MIPERQSRWAVDKGGHIQHWWDYHLGEMLPMQSLCGKQWSDNKWLRAMPERKRCSRCLRKGAIIPVPEHLTQWVRIHPGHGFGRPTVHGTGNLLTFNVADLYRGERGDSTLTVGQHDKLVMKVAHWFGIHVDAVKACIEYEALYDAKKVSGPPSDGGAVNCGSAISEEP